MYYPVRCVNWRLPALAVVLFVAFDSAHAQLRVATYNVAADTGGFTTVRPGFDTIIQGMGNEVVNGFARPLDILTLQETTSNATTVAPVVNTLNSMYGAGVYAQSPYQATQNGSPESGNGPNAIVYNTTTLQLIASVGIGTPSGSGPPRQPVRYQFRPVGYGSSSDFYVYVSHFKSAADATSENRRNLEAIALRTNANTLPAGSRVLYTGDFNLFKGSDEPAWITLTGTGSFGTTNRAVDPVNLGNGSWDGSLSQFRSAYTYSPTSLAYRDDLVFNTAPTQDGDGFAFIPGSSRVFMNNGTTPLFGPVTSGSNTANPTLPNRAAVLNAMANGSDHYPVISDYQLPARMNVAVGGIPAQAIVGANLPVNVTVTNSAPVAVAIGADGLDYTVFSNGSLTGSGAGTALLALAPGNVHVLSVNTSTPGTKSGTIVANSTSQDVGNGAFLQNVSVQVLDHANPSFTTGSDENVATIDFGIKGRTLGNATANFSIANLATTVPGAGTARLDLDSIGGAGSTSALFTSASVFSNLSAGSSNGYFATISDASNGSFTATYTFNLSDENLLGASNVGPLTLVLQGRIATPGDADLNDVIDFDDYVLTDGGYNGGLSGWGNGDFDGNGAVDFDDYVLIDFFFNQQGGGRAALIRAMNYLTGEDRSATGLDTPGMQVVLQHVNQFGVPYASAFVSAVPEPGGALGAAGTISAALLARRRQRGSRMALGHPNR